MAKTIHVWFHDADSPAHVPAGSSKGGQFTSGSGGGGGSAKPAPSSKPAASSSTGKPMEKAMVNHLFDAIGGHKDEAKLQSLASKAEKGTKLSPADSDKLQEVVGAAVQEESDPIHKAKLRQLFKHLESNRSEGPSPASGSKAAATHVMHKGEKHTATGKTGKHLGTGETMHEYEKVDASGKRTGSRIWQTASGKIHED